MRAFIRALLVLVLIGVVGIGAFHQAPAKVTKDTKVKSTPTLKVEEIKAGTRVVITATQAKGQVLHREVDRGRHGITGNEVARQHRNRANPLVVH